MESKFFTHSGSLSPTISEVYRDIKLKMNVKLTPAEKILILIYPIQAYIIYDNSEAAFSMNDLKMGIGDALNNKKDAFRHAFFQAINVRDVPGSPLNVKTGAEIVDEFAHAHESEVPPQLQLEKDMDIYNNTAGILYSINSSSNNSDMDIANDIFTILINGGLKYISPLNFSFSDYYDIDQDGIQDCPTCLNGILPTSTLIPTNQ